MNESYSRIRLIVATHKSYPMPEDVLYLPIQVGADIPDPDTGKTEELGLLKDNTGDNISRKNPQYCELTGLYWAWKHIKADYLGLVQYRRYFVKKSCSIRKMDARKIFSEVILKAEDAERLAERYKIIVPRKRRYYIETLYSHYAHTHYAEHLDETRKIISGIYPDYLDSFDEVMRHTYGHMFNMMIMERSLMDNYCEWLFNILAQLEKSIDKSEYTFYQGRYFGRVAEIIFNVWLDHQVRSGTVDKKEIKELPYIRLEKVNWFKKGSAFLQAKFFKKKYVTSF